MRTKDSVKSLTIQLSGGLGNQLFEYVAGLLLAHQRGWDLNVDVSQLSNHAISHGNSLEDLCLTGNFVNVKKQPVYKYFLHRLAVFLQRKFPGACVSIPFVNRYYSSQEIGFDEGVQNWPRANFIRGYFQSWRYLNEVRARGISFEPRLALESDWFRNNITNLREMNPVVLHIRRGDYLLQGDDWGVLELGYYKNALSEIGFDNDDPVWIFSDDPIAARQVLSPLALKKAHYVSPPDDSPAVESMLLMASARKIVIANSTFSWWSASLGDMNNKVVVAPERWFRNKPDPRDLIPDSWLRVGSF